MGEHCCSGNKGGSSCGDSKLRVDNHHHHHHHHHEVPANVDHRVDSGSDARHHTGHTHHTHESNEKATCCSAGHCHEEKLVTDTSSLCLAVVREDGTDIVVFDASGKPCSYTYKGDIRKLCFKTHGTDIADDLLTPCFDEYGNHGSPEEDCFCGVDTPHLHAHLYDPKTCRDEATAASEQKGSQEDKIGYLASQVLHPSEQLDTEKTAHAEFLFNVNVSDQMPKECNSKQVDEHLRNSGKGKHYRRMHKVQHDDHVDYLVHDSKTGSLYLEHPCNDCGQDDVHGAFRPVGARRLRRSDRSEIQLHFFEVASRPFSILDFLHSAFEPMSDRVAAATMESSAAKAFRSKPISSSPKDNKPTKSIVTSTLNCSGICCAAECPQINRILTPLPGVDRILINVPLKQVIVKHDPRTISATDLEKALNKERMGASIKRDGAVEAGIQEKNEMSVGRSQFYVKNICCASEIPAINSIVEPMKGVTAVSINTTTKTVYVDHETRVVSAQDICDALNREKFGAEIRFDAATNSVAARSAFVNSTLTVDCTANGFDTETLSSFLRGFDSSQMESFFVDVPSSKITVVHNPFCLTAEQVVKMLKEDTGLVATVTLDGADPAHWTFPKLMADDTEIHDNTDITSTRPKPAVILSGVFWIISMFHYVGGNWEYLKYVGLLSVAFGLPPIAWKAFRTLRRFQFDTNCLMFFASLGAVGLQDYAEAAAVVFLFAVSEWLEVRATSRARDALSAIVQLRPDKANLIHPFTKELITVPAASLPVGALVAVRTGDKIPCDGILVSGSSTVDESSLTGESRPISKGPNDTVSGGTVNSGLSQLMVRTTSTAENSAVARLIRLVEEAQANRSETEKLVDDFARWYTPIIVFGAILMCSIPWAFGKDAGKEWTANGLILIVIACPCSLIISTPVSYVAGLAATAQRGILIKGGATLEALGMVKNICFDKTGTLTNGEFKLLHMRIVPNKLSRIEAFQYLSLIEERASHPVAQAIVQAARNEKVTVPERMELEKHMILAGEGVEGVINGLSVCVGNERLFERLMLLDELDERIRSEVESWKTLGGTIGFMSVEGHGIVCAYCAADGIRIESAHVVQQLRDDGINVVMLTGDNQDAAQAIGRQVGLSGEQIKSKLLPEEKLRYITELSSVEQSRSLFLNPFGKKLVTLMCGDGVNDAPALAAANIGVAMGAGAALAMETADVTLLDSNLEKLLYCIKMGKLVSRKIKENVVFSVIVKLVVLGFAIAGKTHLWAAIGTDVGAMILVTLNSMTLLPRKQTAKDIAALKGDIEEGYDGELNEKNSKLPINTKSNLDTKTGNSKGCCSHKSCSSGTNTSSGNRNCVDNVAISSGCKKGCCGGKKAGVKENPQDCKKGCCGEKVAEVKEKPQDCKKSCCGEKVAEMKEKTQDCKKGCCGGKEAGMKENTQDCKKGCCGDKEAEVKEKLQDCKKGCCGGKKAEVKEKPQDCKKGCCGEKVAEVKVKPQECKKGCCGGKVAEVKEKPQECKKGCSGEKVAEVKEKPQECKKGCCGGKVAEVKDKPQECKKGCCGGKEAGAKETTQECKKGCCGEKVAEVKEKTQECKKGCCGEKVAEVKEKTQDCKKGCCGEKVVEEKPQDCKKGCCGGKVVEVKEKLQDCKKGCCGGKEGA